MKLQSLCWLEGQSLQGAKLLIYLHTSELRAECIEAVVEMPKMDTVP